MESTPTKPRKWRPMLFPAAVRIRSFHYTAVITNGQVVAVLPEMDGTLDLTDFVDLMIYAEYRYHEEILPLLDAISSAGSLSWRQDVSHRCSQL